MTSAFRSANGAEWVTYGRERTLATLDQLVGDSLEQVGHALLRAVIHEGEVRHDNKNICCNVPIMARKRVDHLE